MICLHITALLIAAILLWLGLGARRIGTVSRGAPIGARSQSALLLIDLQAVFWESGPYSDTSKAEAASAILDEVALARKQGYPVIAVRQEWSLLSTKIIARLTMKGQAIEGTPGTELAAPFRTVADHSMVKRVQDAFESKELDRLLAQLDVGRLRLVGLDLNYCVAKTALAAKGRGYEVTIPLRSTLAASAPDATLTQLEKHGIMVE
jgi:nicotinamidase-related amidase